MRFDPSLRSVISLAFNDPVRFALKEGGQSFLELDRRSDILEDLLGKQGSGASGIVVDPGDFGIEPCLYIFGSSPLEISARAVEIERMIGGSNV